ncbi:MAG: pilus assembly protein [Armatimonadetes bacterium]|nr:pilus assembly protein [Armatimonadota bacterium]MDW8121465.1 pilus assembly protein [Armatimonadota bacterium]
MKRGQALLELAISIIFLVLVLAGIADYGRALIVQIALRNAAREGALYAALNPVRDNDQDGRVHEDPRNGADDDGDGRVDEDPNETLEIREVVRREARRVGITLADNEIVITPALGAQQGQPITVTINKSIPTLFVRLLGINSIPVNATASAPVIQQ